MHAQIRELADWPGTAALPASLVKITAEVCLPEEGWRPTMVLFVPAAAGYALRLGDFIEVTVEVTPRLTHSPTMKELIHAASRT